jgi:peptidyl-prolyl cis-trans isomerase SurA
MKRLLAIAFAATVVGSGLAAVHLPATAQQTPTAQPSQPTASRGRTVDGVMASVNDQVISHSDVRNRMRWMMLRFAEPPKDEKILLEIQTQALESLIDERVQSAEFHKLVKDGTFSKEEIDEAVADVARQYRMSPDQFATALGQAGIPMQHIRDMEEASIAWSNLIRGRYYKTVRVSELRIDDMLHRLKNSLDKPQYRIAEIFLYAPDQASRDMAKERAATIIQNVQKGADFSALAEQFSAAPSASAGGDLNWLSPGDMRPEVAEAVLKAPVPPVVLQPIESEGGIYIIALTGKREPSDPTKSTILDMEQVIARGEGSTAKLEALKTKAATCGDLTKALEAVEGVTRTPMKNVGISQIAPQYRASLEGVTANQSTKLIDTPDGGKMVFFVCSTKSGDADLPSHDEIKDRLFNQELALVAERYLRDLKREATVVRR